MKAEDYRKTLREADIQQSILDYLKLCPGAFWRQNTGAVKREHKGKVRHIHFGLRGSADITGITQGGRRVEIEVKSHRGRLSPEQEEFKAMIEGQGGLFVVARSVEDVEAAGIKP